MRRTSHARCTVIPRCEPFAGVSGLDGLTVVGYGDFGCCIGPQRYALHWYVRAYMCISPGIHAWRVTLLVRGVVFPFSSVRVVHESVCLVRE